MKYNFIRACIALMAAIQVLLVQLPAAAFAQGQTSPAETTFQALEPGVPEETIPQETQLEETFLQEPQPEETVPEEPQPEEMVPQEPQPEETVPQETQPEETVPQETQPEETFPQETQPEETVPQETQPEETIPLETRMEETAPAEAQPEKLRSEGTDNKDNVGPGLYFGQLHGHTGQCGDTPAEVFSYGARMGLDFFALTDHSHGFDEKTWRSGKAAAAAATTDRFVAIYGYEISWPRQMRLGHMTTLSTAGYLSWKQPEYSDYETALTNYYQALSADAGSISQFNHPGSQYGTFLDFDYSEEGDRAVALMEFESGAEEAWDFYIQALDSGWHLAPADNRKGRTAVYGDSLTEEDLYDALRACRAYATGDEDLRILYTIDGHMLGSRLRLDDVGQTMTLSVTLSDPTDREIGLVEVIADGGRSLAEGTVTDSSGMVSFSLDAKPGYYLIRVTQPDGDQAVTAPIWIEEASGGAGIESLTCETAVPEQYGQIQLTVELYNREKTDFLVESLTIYEDEVPIPAVCPDQIKAGGQLSLPVTLTCGSVGRTTLRAVLSGTLAGEPRQAEAVLELTIRQSSLARDILVDAAHGNQGLNRLSLFEQMAEAEGIQWTVCRNGVSAGDLEGAGLLLIPAPSEPFSPEFLAQAAAYVRYGGLLTVCGQGTAGGAELNRLLEAVGSTMRMEPQASGGDALYVEEINRTAPWCGSVSEHQHFRADTGAAVYPGSGTWLVKGSASPDGAPVLLAWEALSDGGGVLACGSLFLADEAMGLPETLWAEPLANRTIAEALLGLAQETLPLRTIREARAQGTEDQLRIRGYTTAGTWKAHNAFGNTIYLQDETGGIWAGPVSESLRLGVPLELTGRVTEVYGNRYLEISGCRVLDASRYRWTPREGSWPHLLREANEGTLVQVEGKCLEVYSQGNDPLSGCLLEDGDGNRVRLLVEAHIGNGSNGRNELHQILRKGRKIRAIGLVYVEESGETVLRIRNCEEVVYVPPRNLPPYNPPTRDTALIWPLHTMGASVLLLHIPHGRKKTSG